MYERRKTEGETVDISKDVNCFYVSTTGASAWSCQANKLLISMHSAAAFTATYLGEET